MKIRRVVHRGLRRFIEKDDPSGLPPGAVERLRNILTFLQEMARVQELYDIPGWRAHQLKGGRKGTWSISVSRNWRITFEVDESAMEILDLNYEDYH